MVNEYANTTIRDANGNIVGYQPVTTEAPYNPNGVQGAPSQAYQDIQQQYEQQHYASVGSSPAYQQDSFQKYDPSGDVGFSGNALKYKEQWQPLQQSRYSQELVNQPERSTVPVRDLSSGMGNPLSNQTVTVYVPEGRYNQQQIPNAKLGLGYGTGEIAIYEPVRGHSLYNLVGGGSRYAAQSGMFSINEPLTPNVIARGDVGRVALASGVGQSRLGSEAYDGRVQNLDGRVLTPDAQMSQYKNPNNLANYVNPQGANLGKAVAPGADIPWSTTKEAPAIMYMDTKGFIPGSGVNVPASSGIVSREITVPKDYVPFANGGVLSGGNKVAGTATITPISPSQQNLGPVGLEELLANRAEYSGGLLGQWAFGSKAPEVIKGYVGSVSDFGTSLLGWTPFRDKMQVTDPSLQQFRTEKEAMVTATPEEYNRFLADNVAKGNLVSQPGSGTLIENPRLTYDYGEYTKWGVGAGDVVKGKLNITDAQLTQYQARVESRKGIEYIPEKLVFGTGATLSTHPEKIATAFGAGAAMLVGGEIVGGAYAATSLPARAAAFALSHPTAAAVGSGAITYGVPAVLGGATYYGASEGLTASPERTTVNFGRMIPEAGGLIYGGGAASVAIRGADAGLFGFVNKETKVIDLRDTIDLTNTPFKEPGKARAYEIDMWNLPTERTYTPRNVPSSPVTSHVKAPYEPFISGAGTPRTSVSGGSFKTTEPLSMKVDIPVIDLRQTVDLTNAKLKVTDAYAPGGIKTRRTLEQRNFEVGDPFTSMRRKGTVSMERPGSRYSGVSEASKIMGELPEEIQMPVQTTRQRPETMEFLITPSRTIEMPKLQTIQIPEQTTIAQSTYVPTSVQASRNISLIDNAQVQKVNAGNLPVIANTQQQVQQPTKTYIPDTFQIQNPVYPKTPTPQTPFIPSYTPEPRRTPERPYVPYMEPPKTPAPEKPYVPWVDTPYKPTPDKPIPPVAIPLIIIPPFGGFDFPSGGGPTTGTKRRKRAFRETFNIGLDLSTFGSKAYNPMGGPAGGSARKTKAPKKKATIKQLVRRMTKK